MYYTRTANPPAGQDPVVYDRRFAMKDFDFTNLINYKNSPIIKHVARKTFTATDFGPEENPLGLNKLNGAQALFDFASAVVTQLHYRKYVNSKEMVREVNEFFHQSIIEAGFSLCALPQELDDLIQKPGIEVIIAGAQTRSIWVKRVDAGMRLLRELKFPDGTVIDLTFTGRCPEGGGRILNEAGDMLHYFEEKRSDEPLPSGITVRIHREGEARDTKENIRRSFGRLTDPILDNSHCFFISSLFHLPRLANEVKDILAEHPEKARQITVVSAQQFINMPEEPYEEATYMKSALFEFFTALLPKAIEDIEARPGHKSAR